MSVESQHPSSNPTLPTTSASPNPTSTTSSYPLRDRSTLVRPERDLPDPSTTSSAEAGGGRREKFLDQFLASVAPFPAVLHGKLSRMRELDEACVVRMRELDEHSRQHVHNIRHKWGRKEDKPQSTEPQPTSSPPITSVPISSASASAFSSHSSSPTDPSSSSPPTSEQSTTAATTATTVTSGPNAMSVKFGTDSTYDIEAAELHLRTQRDELLRLTRAKQTLASECYEGVDGHIRRLDVSLRKYETKLRKGTFDVTAQPVDRRKGSEVQWDTEGRTMAAEVAAEMKGEIDRMEGTGGGRRVKGRGEGGAGGGEGGKGEGEPTYCLCKKVSFGQMVACDNDDCEIEWFHFACVGLESKPRGKWLCPQCRDGGKKKKSKKDK